MHGPYYLLFLLVILIKILEFLSCIEHSTVEIWGKKIAKKVWKGLEYVEGAKASANIGTSTAQPHETQMKQQLYHVCK